MSQSDDELKAELKALASSADRSKIGRLRGVFSEVEEARRAGISNKKILETLNAHGFELTLKTFETMIGRIKNERKRNQIKTTEQQTVTPKESKSINWEEDNIENDENQRLSKREQRERNSRLYIKDDEIPSNLLDRLKK